VTISDAISAQGTIIRRNGIALARLGDITMPVLTRRAVEDTRHRGLYDAFKVGFKRGGNLEFDLQWLPASDDLFTSWINGDLDAWEVVQPDGSTWSFDGYIIDMHPIAPVDGLLAEHVTVKTAGTIDVGLVSAYLLEDGSQLLLEDGTAMLLE
jgi:hypothetical protein